MRRGSVVVLDELKEVAAREILGSGSGVLVIKPRLHVFRKGKIESELAGVGKGKSGADPVGAFHRHSLNGGGLNGIS